MALYEDIPARIFRLVAAFAVLLMLAGAAGCGGSEGSTASGNQASVVFHALGGDATLTVEVARTSAERALGLMKRSSLAADHGMIFIWDQPTRSAFWMKNTLIPLSVAFIAADGTIIDIQQMQPQTTDPHAPGQDYLYAVEANQGYFSEHGVTPGSKLEIRGL